MRYKLIILFFSLLFSILAFSQEQPTELTLDEAINYALQHNYTALNAQRDIESAKKKRWETTAMGLPQINATIDYQNWLKQQISLIPAEFFGGNQGEFAEVAFGTKQSINATATLSQLLFDGSYLVGLQSAKVFLEISKNAKEKTDLEIRKATINAYGNVLLAEESVKILEKNKTNLIKTLQETQQIYENGLTEEESVEQLQITLAGIENSLTNAIRLNELAYKMLNITLGLELAKKIVLTEDLALLTTKNIDFNLLGSSLNLEDNIDYKIAKNSQRSKELLLKYEKSKSLPRLTAFINGGYSGYNEAFKFSQKEQRWFGSSLFGVSLNVPIFSSFGRSSKTKQAKINLEKANTNLTEIEQQLQLQTETAKSNYQFSVEQYINSKNNLRLTERIEHKNQIKYAEGIATSFELRQAQIQMYTSQQEYLKSMLNVISLKTELEVILNKISSNSEQTSTLNIEKGTATDETTALKEKVIEADTKTQQKNTIEEATTIEKRNNDTKDKLVSTDKEQSKKTIVDDTRISTDTSTKPIARPMNGVENGFYLIASVFSKKKNLTVFIEKLQNKGLQPSYFYNTKRELYYVYLKKDTVLISIETAKKTKFNGQYLNDTWILSVQN